MPHDPALLADTRSWLEKARQDLRAASVGLGADPPLLADAVFHCQQAAEKAFKAFLTWHDRPFRKTHDLTELGHGCIDIDGSLAELARAAERLTVFAWVFRYPGEPEEPTREETDEARVIATDVYKAVVSLLPAEVDGNPW